MESTVYFGKGYPQNSWLHMWSNYPIVYREVVYPTREHFYQCQKFGADNLLIRQAPNAFEAAKLGRTLPGCLPDWDSLRFDAMTLTVRLGYEQHPELAKQLIQTGEAALVENSRDRYWGNGLDNSGENVLGKIHMNERKHLRDLVVSSMRDKIDKINMYAHAYYALDDPMVSDGVYDTMMSELAQLEADYPDLKMLDSPVGKMLDKLVGGWPAVKHAFPMGSLKTSTDYTDNAIIDFVSDLQKRAKEAGIDTKSLALVSEPKYDGLAVSITKLPNGSVQLAVRGNSDTGDNITANLDRIYLTQAVKDFIDAARFDDLRGELVLSRGEFKRINDWKISRGEKTYVNARNAASGIARADRSDPDRNNALKGTLWFMPYAALGHDSSQIEFLQQCWPPNSGVEQVVVRPFFRVYHPDDLGGITVLVYGLLRHRQDLLDLRQALPYDIDGIVYKVNDQKSQAKLGYTGLTPNWALAHKYKPDEVSSKVNAIVHQVGRTGKITPVVQIDPVFVGGTVVSNITLHNPSEVLRKGVCVGKTVFVRRAGDVIPEIVGSGPDVNGCVAYTRPSVCPECGTSLVVDESKDPNKIGLRCPAKQTCPGQNTQRFIHFSGKSGLDIKEFGEKTIEQLYDAGHLVDIGDLFFLGVRKHADKQGQTFEHMLYALNDAQRLDLAYDTLSSLPNTGKKSVVKMLKSLDSCKVVELKKFIAALGIRYVGASTSAALAAYFRKIDGLFYVSKDVLLDIDDIGVQTADSIASYFNDQRNIDTITNLIQKAGFVLIPSLYTANEDNQFVLSGVFEVSRATLAKQIIDRIDDASVADNVSAKTKYLVTGNKPSAGKLAAAKKHTTPILTEQQLLAMFKP